MTEELTPETLDTYDSLMSVLAKTDKQGELIYWLYQEVGDIVAKKLQETETTVVDFKPYDIVGISVKEVLDEFQLTRDYSFLKDVFKNQYDVLVKFLKLGYGTSEQIFEEYGSDDDD